MRLSGLMFLCLCLVSCVSEEIKKLDTPPYTVKSLSQPHVYKIPTHSYYTVWWNKFHDPQLTRLIEVGLKETPDIKTAWTRLKQAQELTKFAGASLWPSLSGAGYWQRQRFSKYGLIPPPFNGRTFNIADIGINMNYEIDFWGKNRETVAANVSGACALYAEFAQIKLLLATSIASTYFQLLAAIAQRDLAIGIYQERKALLEIVTARTQHGLRSEIPVKRAVVELQTATLSVKQYKQTVQLLRHQLAVLIGRNPFNTFIEVPYFRFKYYGFKLPHSIPANLLSNRPDILAARYLTEAAAHRIKVARALFFPNINLSGLFSYQTILFNQLFNPQSQNNYIAGAFDLPLFDAGLRGANLNMRYADYLLYVNQYNLTILTALHEVADQLTVMRTVKSELYTQQTATKATAHNEALIKLRYQHGIIDYEEVLDIHGLLLQQQSVLVDLEAQHLLAIVNLYKALGGYDRG